MIRAFRARDAWRVRRQQAEGIALELETKVILGQSPLQQALAGLIPRRAPELHSLVRKPADNRLPFGLLQARRRERGKRVDLIYIAPALDAHPRASLAWQGILGEASNWLGSQGVEHVQVALPAEEAVGEQVLRRIGFGEGWADRVWCLTEGPMPKAWPLPPGWAAVQAKPEHDLAVDALNGRAERRACLPAWREYPLAGRFPTPTREEVWLDARGQVQGAWRRVGGRGGDWLCFGLAAGSDSPEGPRSSPRAIAEGLVARARLAGDQDRALYAAVPAMQGEIERALAAAGFTCIQERRHWLKHTALQVLEPAWRESKAAERGLEAARIESRILGGRRGRRSIA